MNRAVQVSRLSIDDLGLFIYFANINWWCDALMMLLYTFNISMRDLAKIMYMVDIQYFR